MKSFVESFVQGHHETPSLGEVLQCKVWSSNIKNPYAMAVTQRNTAVRHVLRKIVACSLFLCRSGIIHCNSETRHFSADVSQEGLAAPCIL